MSRLCEPCRRDRHEDCQPVPVARDRHTGEALTTRAGFVDCRCLCDPRCEKTLALLRRAIAECEGGSPELAVLTVDEARNLLLARVPAANVRRT